MPDLDFPTDYPKESATLLVNFLGGSDTTTGMKALARAVWNVVGFFEGQFLPDDPQSPTTKMKAGPPCTKNEAAFRLKLLCDDPSQAHKAAMVGGSFPWQSVVNLLLDLVKQWINSIP